MARFAFICVPQAGHISPMAALAHELSRRGHVVTFLHHEGVERDIRGRGLDFLSLGRRADYVASLESVLRGAGTLKAALGLPALMRDFARTTAMLCEELPARLRALSIDVVVGDWVEAAAGLVAEHLGLPLVSVAAALPFNWEKGIPSPYVGWAYGETWLHRTRNVAAHHVATGIQWHLRAVIGTFAARWRLAPKHGLDSCASRFAQIAQLTPSLDYPRRALIGCFHYCGPLRDPTKARGDGMDRRRSGRAFASLGSMQGHRADVFEAIADAAVARGLELTIAHGGRLPADDAARLSRRAIVRDFVDYDEVLRDTELAIMHGGMNGVLDALAHGVPMAVIPLTFEQPAIAARVRYAGAGVVCGPRALGRGLARAIATIQDDASFAAAAARLRDEIRACGGVKRAADIVEQVARTGRPCLNAGAASADAALAPFAFGAA